MSGVLCMVARALVPRRLDEEVYWIAHPAIDAAHPGYRSACAARHTRRGTRSTVALVWHVAGAPRVTARGQSLSLILALLRFRLKER